LTLAEKGGFLGRRGFLLALGVAAALPFAPRVTQEIWRRASESPPPDGLTEPYFNIVSALADTILPPTDTPGASDAGVPAWISVVVADYYASSERTALLDGLDSIDVLAKRTEGLPFPELTVTGRERVVAVLERPNAYERFVLRLERSQHKPFWGTAGLLARRARAYAQMKTLIVHGYFTSEIVQRTVLLTEQMPRRFEGDAEILTVGLDEAA
jgi:hypothetical protein